jgi:hypothetical protein
MDTIIRGPSGQGEGTAVSDPLPDPPAPSFMEPAWKDPEDFSPAVGKIPAFCYTDLRFRSIPPADASEKRILFKRILQKILFILILRPKGYLLPL